MQQTKSETVVCLANSKKFSGFCFAGKEMTSNSFGPWIRPVSPKGKGELIDSEIVMDNDSLPELLDIVTIPLKDHRPQTYQRENYLVSPEKWQWKGKLDRSFVPELCDEVPQLWVNGYSSAYGYNDRIPQEIAENKIDSSLVFVKSNMFVVQVIKDKSRGIEKYRAEFLHRKNKYNLAITDPRILRLFSKKENGRYSYRGTIYLTVSIGEPFEGFCYKLVAGVISDVG